MLRKHITKARIIELSVYFGVAIVGFAVNVVSRIFYQAYFDNLMSKRWAYATSVTLAYFTGMVAAFILTKLVAFGARTSGNTTREAVKFTMVSMVALTVTLLFAMIGEILMDTLFEMYPAWHAQIVAQISLLGQKWINRELFSHLFGIGFGFFANFFGHKLFTFRTTGYWDKIQARRAVSREQ
ncbi:MAG: GtrA family protein [Bacteroidota bacterium]